MPGNSCIISEALVHFQWITFMRLRSFSTYSFSKRGGSAMPYSYFSTEC